MVVLKGSCLAEKTVESKVVGSAEQTGHLMVE